MSAKAKFYSFLRKRNSGVFGTRLGQKQVEGMEGIFEAWEELGTDDNKHLAYVFATAYHEVGGRMVPVREGFKSSDASARRYVQKHYGHKGRKWYCWPQGPYKQVYYGRGHVQLTWYDNYVKMGNLVKENLAKYPEKALDPVISAKVMIVGMLEGHFNGRGKGLAYYLDKNDLKNARRTVNITDKHAQIARYYRSFLNALEASGYKRGEQAKPEPKVVVQPPVDYVIVQPEEPVRPQPKPKKVWWMFILDAIFKRDKDK